MRRFIAGLIIGAVLSGGIALAGDRPHGLRPDQLLECRKAFAPDLVLVRVCFERNWPTQPLPPTR